MRPSHTDNKDAGVVEKFFGTAYDRILKIYHEIGNSLEIARVLDYTSDFLFYRFRAVEGQWVFEGEDLAGRTLALPGTPVVFVDGKKAAPEDFEILAGGTQVSFAQPLTQDSDVLVSSFGYNADGELYWNNVLTNDVVLAAEAARDLAVAAKGQSEAILTAVQQLETTTQAYATAAANAQSAALGHATAAGSSATEAAGKAADAATAQSGAAQALTDALAAVQAALTAQSGAEGAQSAVAALEQASQLAKSAAEAARDAAQVHATSADGAATAALGHAQTASSHKDAAGVSAAAAAASVVSAELAKAQAAQISGNPDFTLGLDGWQIEAPGGYSAVPGPGGPTGNALVALTGPDISLSTIQKYSYDSSRTYRQRIRFRVTGSAGGSIVSAGVMAYELDGTSQENESGVGAWHWGTLLNQLYANNGVWIEAAGLFTGTDNGANSLQADTAFIRPVILVNAAAGAGDFKVEVDFCILEDVTDVLAAQAAASAAAISASSASTAQTNAGISAAAAQLSVVQAATEKAEAVAAKDSAVLAQEGAETASAAAYASSVVAARLRGGGFFLDPTFQVWGSGDPLPPSIGGALLGATGSVGRNTADAFYSNALQLSTGASPEDGRPAVWLACHDPAYHKAVTASEAAQLFISMQLELLSGASWDDVTIEIRWIGDVTYSASKTLGELGVAPTIGLMQNVEFYIDRPTGFTAGGTDNLEIYVIGSTGGNTDVRSFLVHKIDPQVVVASSSAGILQTVKATQAGQESLIALQLDGSDVLTLRSFGAPGTPLATRAKIKADQFEVDSNLNLFNGVVRSNNYAEDGSGIPTAGWLLDGANGQIKGKSVITGELILPGAVSNFGYDTFTAAVDLLSNTTGAGLTTVIGTPQSISFDPITGNNLVKISVSFEYGNATWVGNLVFRVRTYARVTGGGWADLGYNLPQYKEANDFGTFSATFLRDNADDYDEFAIAVQVQRASGTGAAVLRIENFVCFWEQINK